MKKTIILIILLFFNYESAFSAIKTKPILTLTVADQMAAECLKLATNNGWKINIAIYESPGALKFYASMDGTYAASEEISRLKGKTSAGLPYTTKELAQMAFNGENKNQGIATIPNVALLPGGVPILLKDGYHLGGVGVSGSSGTNDEECAKSAVKRGLEILYEN